MEQHFIPLSVPNFSGREKEYVNDAVVSEWVSTGGSKVADFEQMVADYVHMPRAVACNSGTSGLHLANLVAGVGRGDEVLAVNADGVCVSPNDVPGYAKDKYMPDSMKDENGKAYAYRDSVGNYYEFGFGLGY